MSNSSSLRRNFRIFLVVSLVRPLKPILLRFSSCRKSQMRPSQTRLTTCLFMALPCAADSCVSMRLQGPCSLLSKCSAIQSKEAEKPYNRSHTKKKLYLEATQCSKFTLVFLPKGCCFSHKFPSSVVFHFQNSVRTKQ